MPLLTEKLRRIREDAHHITTVSDIVTEGDTSFLVTVLTNAPRWMQNVISKAAQTVAE